MIPPAEEGESKRATRMRSFIAEVRGQSLNDVRPTDGDRVSTRSRGGSGSSSCSPGRSTTWSWRSCSSPSCWSASASPESTTTIDTVPACVLPAGARRRRETPARSRSPPTGSSATTGTRLRAAGAEPGAKAGLRAGDTIVAIDGEPVSPETDDGWTQVQDGDPAQRRHPGRLHRRARRRAAGPHRHADREHGLRRRRRATQTDHASASSASARRRPTCASRSRAVPGFLGDDRRPARVDRLVRDPAARPGSCSGRPSSARSATRTGRSASSASAGSPARCSPSTSFSDHGEDQLLPPAARRREPGAVPLQPAADLPLDGGHVAGALYEKARATVARLRGRPDPGPFDIARLMPVAYVGRRAVPGAVGAAVRRRHRQPDHPGLKRPASDHAHQRGSAASHRDGAGDTGGMAIPVSLGMPAAPPPVLAPRRKTRQLDVGGVGVGSDFPVCVQSMTTTLTADINATLQQIAELTASGCQIVRVAVPDTDDAEALPAIARKSQIPVIADIHFQPKYVFAAIDAGCAAVRVNPGNIKKFDDKVGEIAQGRQGRRHPDPDRRQRRLAGQAAAGQVRQGHAGGAGRVGAVGVLAVRGARLPRHQDLGQAQRPGGDGAGLRAARRAVRLPAAPRRHRGRPGVPGHDQVRRRLRRAAVARASATPSASPSRPRRSRRSRSACRSSSR